MGACSAEHEIKTNYVKKEFQGSNNEILHKDIWLTLKPKHDNYPTRKTSASLSKAVLIKIGKGYFSNKPGNLTIASHCSPVLLDRRPEVQIASSPLSLSPNSAIILIWGKKEWLQGFWRTTKNDDLLQGRWKFFRNIEMQEKDWKCKILRDPQSIHQPYETFVKSFVHSVWNQSICMCLKVAKGK